MTESVDGHADPGHSLEVLLDKLQAAIEHDDHVLVVRERLVVLHHPSVLDPEHPPADQLLHVHSDLRLDVLPPPDKEGEVGPDELLLGESRVKVFLRRNLLLVQRGFVLPAGSRVRDQVLVLQVLVGVVEDQLGPPVVVDVEGQPPARVGVRVRDQIIGKVIILLW